MQYYSLQVIWPRQSALLWVPANQPIIRGVYANMVSFGTILAGWYCVLIMPRLKHERGQQIGLTILKTALLGALASVGINDQARAITLVILVAAVNLPPTPLSFGMVSLHLKDQTDIGVAVGLISTFRLLGGAVAQVIYTTIQSNRFAQVLPGEVTQAAMATNFNGSMPALLAAATKNTFPAYDAVPGITNSTISAVRVAVKQANANGYKMVFLVAIAFGALAIASACSVKGIDPSQRSNATAARLENESEDKTVTDARLKEESSFS